MLGTQSDPPPPRKIWLFGGLQIADSGRLISLSSGNARSLFAYLVLHPRHQRREFLADLFWPLAPPERVRRSFSNLVYRLRQALGDSWLAIEGETIALHGGPDLWVDVWEFEALLNHPDDPQAARQALTLYRGDLLPEIYTDWLLPRRVALREKILVLLGRLASAAEAEQHLDEAFDHYYRLATEDPLNEAASRGLMRVYARLGRHTAALGEFERLSNLLDEQLGVAPVSETTTLAASIRLDYQALRTDAAPKTTFVGRRQEWAALLREAEKARNGKGGLVLVEGEAGAGKTRLLELAAEGASWRGMTVAWGKAAELAAVDPYAPFDEALQQSLNGLRLARLQEQLSPITLSVLSALAPGLRTGGLQASEMHASAIIDDLPASPDLPAAVVEGLAVLCETGPLLLILDDVQWAGPAFWGLLAFVPQLKRLPVLLALAYRPAALRANQPAWRRLQELDLELAPLRLSLAGLQLDECAELARQYKRQLSPGQIEALRQATGGNPLYLQELLETSAGAALPPSLAGLLHERLKNLSARARQALEVAAVLGREFTQGLWQSLGGSVTAACVPELLAARFIEETHHGYQFLHDLTRQQVYNEIKPLRLRQLHRLAAEAALREHAAPQTLAWHYERGELWEAALHYRLRAGERAMQAYAYQAALEEFNLGMELLARLPDSPEKRLALLLRRQRVLRLLARLEAWRRDVDEIERLATRLDDSDALLEALEARIRLTNIDSDMAGLRLAIQRALSLVPEADDPALEAHVLNTAGFYLADSLGENREAMPHLHRAVDLAGATQETALFIQALCNLSFAQWAAGRCQAAHQTAARALAASELHSGHFPARAHALAALGQVAMGLSQWEQARDSLRKAISLYEELADAWNVGDTLYNFAVTTSAMGQHTEAIQAAERLLHLAQRSGLPLDSDLGIWYQSLLLRVYSAAGEFKKADAMSRLVEARVEVMQTGRALIIALTALGENDLATQRVPQAAARLARAVRLWQPTKNYGDVLCALQHARAAFQAGDVPAAQASLSLAGTVLAESDASRYQVLYEYVSYLVSGEGAHLESARSEIQRQAALFANPALRQAFLNEVRLHRLVESRWLAFSARFASISHEQGTDIPASIRTVLLARAGIPLGKRLSEEDKIAVHWTVDAGEVDAAILRQAGKAALRRERIRRLLAEARAQGAVPTDEDLAQALSISRRTILRDMAVLETQGEELTTRRRRS